MAAELVKQGNGIKMKKGDGQTAVPERATPGYTLSTRFILKWIAFGGFQQGSSNII